VSSLTNRRSSEATIAPCVCEQTSTKPLPPNELDLSRYGLRVKGAHLVNKFDQLLKSDCYRHYIILRISHVPVNVTLRRREDSATDRSRPNINHRDHAEAKRKFAEFALSVSRNYNSGSNRVRNKNPEMFVEYLKPVESNSIQNYCDRRFTRLLDSKDSSLPEASFKVKFDF
jgi:hypothetical protein